MDKKEDKISLSLEKVLGYVNKKEDNFLSLTPKILDQKEKEIRDRPLLDPFKNRNICREIAEEDLLENVKKNKKELNKDKINQCKEIIKTIYGGKDVKN